VFLACAALFKATAVARHVIPHGSAVTVRLGWPIFPETWPPPTWLDYDAIPDWPGRIIPKQSAVDD
jgi:hypothetical protein